ncbi:MAG: hypothetical protein U0670_00055 [Anaerolineae bacterium]
MRIQRAGVSRGSGLPIMTCGCLAIGVGTVVLMFIAVLILLPEMPNIAAQMIGLTPLGSVDEAFVANPVVIPAVQDAQPVDQVTFNVEGYGQQVIQDQPQLYDFTLGTVNGQQAVTATFTETGLLDLCRQRTTLCSGQNPQIQNVSIDLRPGGAIVYADATLAQLGGISQRMGAVLTLDASGRRLEFAGVDINGSLFNSSEGDLGTLVNQIEQGANEILTTLTLQAGGSQYRLSRISIDDGTLTLFLQ